MIHQERERRNFTDSFILGESSKARNYSEVPSSGLYLAGLLGLLAIVGARYAVWEIKSRIERVKGLKDKVDGPFPDKSDKPK